MENTPKSEKIAPDKEAAADAYRKMVLKLFENFRARPDQPSYSYEEQGRLAAESSEAEIIAKKTGTEEAKAASERASLKFLESKSDKKHISTIIAPLLAAKSYLEEGLSSMPQEKKEVLLKKIDDIYRELDVAREIENISDELVKKVLNTLDEIEINIK